MNERSFRTPALILKRRDFGEADRLLTLLSPAHGKFNAIARGARKPTNSRTGHVELFTRVDMLLQRGRELHSVSQVEVQAPYLPLREDLTRGAYASFAAEVADRFSQEGEDDSADLFDLLDATFERLCHHPDPRLVSRFYELHLLDLVGFRPQLTVCVFTGDPIQPQDQFFSFAEGGVVSPEAARFASSLRPLPLDVLKVLRHIQRSPFAHLESLRLSDGLHQRTERLMLDYLAYVLERRLQSVDFIRRIRALSAQPDP